MRKAYCIITHKNTPILRELIKSSKDSTDIYLYVDGKIDLTIFNEYIDIENVNFIQNRREIKWGNISQVEATIELLKTAKKKPFDYLFLLSGDCLPIKNDSKINEFLGQNKAKEFIARDINMPQKKIDNRIKFIYPEMIYNKNRTIFQKVILKLNSLVYAVGGRKNKSFDQLPKLYKGTQWFGITKELCDYILDYLDKNKNYLGSFQKSFCSDEIFFHTIVYNSKFRDNIYAPKDKTNICFQALRYIDWKTGPDYPRTLDENDFIKIKNTECIFARKFNENLDIKKYRKKLLDL